MPLDPKKLSPAAQKRLAKEILAFKAAHEPRPWETQARNKQLPPDHPLHSLPWTHPKTGQVYSCGCNGNNPEWTTWIFMAGRGTGKTLAGAQWALAMALSEPNIYVGVCAPTFIHVRKTCFEDLQSGILACALPGEITEVNKNNLQITLRNGSIIQGFSAENADSVRGSNLSYCWFDELACLFPGTMIRCADGDKAIKDVHGGDYVWTRSGLRRVRWAGPTRRNAEMWLIGTGSGSIRCTPDHRIWTDHGWREARFVKPGDKLLSWKNCHSPLDLLPGSTGTGSAGIASISEDAKRKPGKGTTVIPAEISCTGWSGNELTVPSRMAASSITRIMTRLITAWTISSFLIACLSTARSIRKNGSIRTGVISKAVKPAKNALSGSGLNANLANIHASGAEASSCHAPSMAQNTAIRSAECDTVVTSSARLPSREPVTYDITVDGDPEFFADGFLVHNSIKFTRFFDYGLKPALRIKPKNNDPRLMITTTPTKLRLIRDLVEQAEKDTRRFHITTASSNENPYFAEGALEDLRRQYKGTYLEQQELEGRLVLGSDGALFSIENFCEFRIYPEDLPELRRIVVAIDPASTSSETSDETGIVVAGEGPGHHFYILEDCSLRGSPKKCMETVAHAYHRWEADLVVGENTVGDYMPELLAKEDPNIPYKSVAAMKGKYIRAEPISHLATNGRMHMVGDSFELLEKQLSAMTPDIERSRQHDDRADACLASGTMILTPGGEIPVEDVQAGDFTWTRAGWKPVTAARCTQRNAEVMTMTMSDGHQLSATPDHRIWTENRGWCRMDSLVYGDTLSAWKNHQLRSFTGEFFTGVTRKAQGAATGFTTSITAPGQNLSPTCTAKSGKTTILERSYPLDGIFITRTRTRSTTILPISCSLLPVSTRTSIQETDLISQSTWRESARSLRNGTLQKTGTPGMSSTGSAPGRGGNLTMIASVRNAGKDSSASGTEAGTVPVNVSTGHTASPTGTMPGCRARSAGKSSGRTVTATDPGPAPVSVVSVCASLERKDVYDLSVADIHEFTANGIIVHNCIWAMTELSRRSSASFKEMYGFFPCPECGEDVNQVMDKTCRHCGHPVSPQKEEKIRDRSTRWAGAYKKNCVKGHEYPMYLEECPECVTPPGSYLAQVAKFTGNGNSVSYTNRDWLAGMRKR